MFRMFVLALMCLLLGTVSVAAADHDWDCVDELEGTEQIEFRVASSTIWVKVNNLEIQLTNNNHHVMFCDDPTHSWKPSTAYADLRERYVALGGNDMNFKPITTQRLTCPAPTPTEPYPACTGGPFQCYKF